MRSTCPVLHCGWSYDWPVQRVEFPLDGVIAQSPGGLAYLKGVVDVQNMHTAGHTSEEFVHTIMAMNSYIESLRAQIELAVSINGMA